MRVWGGLEDDWRVEEIDRGQVNVRDAPGSRSKVSRVSPSARRVRVNP